MKLDDQFEWDLDYEAVISEEFAEVYVQDLGLNGVLLKCSCVFKVNSFRIELPSCIQSMNK